MALIDNNNGIYLLDNTSQAKIRSAVQILSLTDVIVELVKNALDAQASSIKVVLNYAAGFCSVLDDGYGIPANEFSENGRLAQAYCTSKLGPQSHTYGRHGRYLAALAGVSLLSITSRAAGEHNTNVLWLDESGRLGHIEEQPHLSEMKRGTRVKVHNLFSRLPVRRKHLADRFTDKIEVHKEFGRLKHLLTGLIFAFPRSFELHVQHSSSACIFHHKLTPAQSVRMARTDGPKSIGSMVSALHHAGYVDRACGADWRQSTITLGGIEIHAVISLEPVPHKLVQFMAINHRPLTKQTHPEVFQLINALFDNSSFGALGHASDDSSGQMQESKHLSRRSRHGQSKNVDRWPMFVIWVSTDLEVADGLVLAIGAHDQNQKLMARITSLLETLTKEFLTSHDFHTGRVRDECHSEHSLKAQDTARADLSQRSPSQSSQEFRHWSRVKSSRASVMDNILTGLPFQKAKSESQSVVLEHRHKSSPPISESGSTVVADELPDVSAILDGTKTRFETAIEWADPRTGRALRIDPRTGIVLPDTPCLPNTHTSTGPHTPLVGGDRAPQRGRRKKDRVLSLQQVVDNVRRYSTGWPTNQHQPIRSMALFSDLGESLQEQASTRRKQIDIFWEAADHCQGHHRAPAAQLEIPCISKDALPQAKVLRQLDNKFILALVPEAGRCASSDAKLVLIDQHAADERCKVENLLKAVQEDEPIVLARSLRFEVSATEAQMLDTLKRHFLRWNIVYEVNANVGSGNVADAPAATREQQEVWVTALPSAIAERCRLRPKLIIELLREEIWSEEPVHRVKSKPSGVHHNKRRGPVSRSHVTDQQTTFTMSTVPSRLLDLVNSRACRSAIMFNDELTTDQCEGLVEQLSKCALPFQCAHGRPSMVVLSDLASFPHHQPLAPTSTTSDLVFAEAGPDHTASPITDSPAATLGSRRPTTGGEAVGSNSASQTPTTTASSCASPQGHPALNSIDDYTTDFGQAYRAWMVTEKTALQAATP